jgi:hypothetical protein
MSKNKVMLAISALHGLQLPNKHVNVYLGVQMI